MPKKFVCKITMHVKESILYVRIFTNYIKSKLFDVPEKLIRITMHVDESCLYVSLLM